MTTKSVQEEIEKKLASDLKTRFLNERENSHKDFHICDVKRLKESESLDFRLFIRARQGDLEKAHTMMVDCLKWRKSYNINDTTEKNLDPDILKQGILYYNETNKKGLRILIFHGNKYSYKKDTNKAKALEKIFAYHLERQKKEHPGKQLMVICDHQGAELTNVDLDFFKFLVNLFNNYYPHILDSFVVLDVPWRLSAVWKVIKSWLSPDMSIKFKFMDRSKLTDLVDISNILTSMGGEGKYEYTWNPSVHEQLLVSEVKRNNSNDLLDRSSYQGDTMEDRFYDSEVEEDVLPKKEEKPAMGSSLGTQVRNRFTGNQSSLKDKPSSDPDLEENPLVIRPNEEIVFREVEHENEVQETLTLTNISSNTIIFKIKTNSPANFRVRPNVGGLLSGSSKEVTLMLLLKGDSDQEKQHGKDKFLILFSETNQEINSATDFPELWKGVPKIDISEHRLDCRVLDVNGLEKRPKTIEDVIEMSLKSKHQLLQLQTKVNGVSKSLLELKDDIQKQSILLLIIMLGFIILACLLFWFR